MLLLCNLLTMLLLCYLLAMLLLCNSHCVCSQLSDVHIHYAVLLCVWGGPISYRVTGIKLCSFLMKTSLFAEVTNYL